jgi:hypothetical protein
MKEMGRREAQLHGRGWVKAASSRLERVTFYNVETLTENDLDQS